MEPDVAKVIVNLIRAEEKSIAGMVEKYPDRPVLKGWLGGLHSARATVEAWADIEMEDHSDHVHWSPSGATTRMYTAACRSPNGGIKPVGCESTDRAEALETVHKWHVDEAHPRMFIAYRDVPEWTEEG